MFFYISVDYMLKGGTKSDQTQLPAVEDQPRIISDVESDRDD